MPLPTRPVRAQGVTRLRWIWCCGLVILLALLRPTQAAEHPPLPLTGPADTQMLGRYLRYQLDPGRALSVQDFAGPSALAMQPLAGSVPDFGYTPARIWLRLPVVNHTAQRDWYLYLHANFTQTLRFYRIGADGTVHTLLDLTEDAPFSARPMAGPRIVVPFALAPGEAATLVVAYSSVGATQLRMSLQTQDGLAQATRTTLARSYTFYGMMLLMIVLALVAWALLRQPVLAAYVGYLASVLACVAQADGTAFQYLWPEFPRFNDYAPAVFFSSAQVFGGLFAISFLRTARLHPVLHRVLLGVVASVLLLNLALWWSDLRLLKQTLVHMIAITNLVYFGAGLVALRRHPHRREVHFFVLAWLAALCPAFLFTAMYAFGMEVTRVNPFDALRVALAVDTLMMGLSVFDHYHQSHLASLRAALEQARQHAALAQRLAGLEQRYAQTLALSRRREEGLQETAHDLHQPMQTLRQMCSAQAREAGDAHQAEALLGSMEKIVAEHLADPAGPDTALGAVPRPRLRAHKRGGVATPG